MLAPTSHAHVQDSRHARLGLPRENVHLPDGLAEDSEAIRALGGLDLQLLGITLRGLTKRQLRSPAMCRASWLLRLDDADTCASPWHRRRLPEKWAALPARVGGGQCLCL